MDIASYIMSTENCESGTKGLVFNEYTVFLSNNEFSTEFYGDDEKIIFEEDDYALLEIFDPDSKELLHTVRSIIRQKEGEDDECVFLVNLYDIGLHNSIYRYKMWLCTENDGKIAEVDADISKFLLRA